MISIYKKISYIYIYCVHRCVHPISEECVRIHNICIQLKKKKKVIIIKKNRSRRPEVRHRRHNIIIPSVDHLRDPLVVFGHVLVAPPPDATLHVMVVVVLVVMSLGAVARPPRPFLHQTGVGRLQVVRQPDPGAPVDERRAEVQPVVAQLGRLVVPRKRVMVVVPALAERQQRHHRVLGGRDVPEDRRTITTYYYIVVIVISRRGGCAATRDKPRCPPPRNLLHKSLVN